MAAVQRKLVHKQFNSPMGLYSQENVKATLDRELKAFGAEGIEVDDQISKPLNLANSAVLRAVEEEEQQAKSGYKRVAWPPASEERIIREFTPQPATQSPAPGSGGYYPQSVAAPPSHAAAAPPQGPIYNNVQPRTTQPSAPQQSSYTPQNVYGNPQPTSQYPDSYPYQPQQQQPHQQQPVQYSQAQFNRQRSREPVQAPAPAPAPAPVSDYANASANAYPNYQSNYPQQEPLQAGNNVGGGWKHIGAPQPKAHNEFTVPGSGSGSGVGSLPQQQYHQQPNYQQQQQQYGAPSYGGYQQQPAPQQPAPQWQQQQQQVPQQQYQPQPQAQAPYQQPQWNQQQPSYQSSPYQQQPSQQQPSYYPQQNGGSTFAQPQYNSYSQPQQQQQLPYSQDQLDLQQQPGAFAGQDSYRGASPGIITLRKEAPVTQKPAPVYTSQPAAVSYQGGSKLRGDLKWPPPEYKEAAARENEERRLLALGPVCRPRRVNRQDYTGFFAKHQLNNAYPSYKVPPGTQHMFA
ncbi:uncharacterized protein [Drosophila bipectinata]|uniref:uncharacterized protein isoform X3 n=1 Tax=Drosophila bipectinata TaxID=42026 RepID=UPI0038B40E72